MKFKKKSKQPADTPPKQIMQSSSNSAAGTKQSSHASSGNNSNNTMSKSKSETVNYLLLYEAMVRHQDLEFDATHDHIALTMGRIQYLGRKSSVTISSAPELINEGNKVI